MATITAEFSRTEAAFSGRGQAATSNSAQTVWNEGNVISPSASARSESGAGAGPQFLKVLQVMDLIGRRGDRARADCRRHQKTSQHDQTGYHHLLQESLQRFSFVAQAEDGDRGRRLNQQGVIGDGQENAERRVSCHGRIVENPSNRSQRINQSSTKGGDNRAAK